jgi:hypothetical protein
MKKTYKSLMTCTTWAALASLVIVIGPTTGFGQDANGVTNEPATEAASEVTSESAKESRDISSAYRIITERNMFSRNRRLPRADPGPAPVVRQPNPESYYILRGIVRENDTFIAFLQDNRQGGVLQLREGDKVARGTVKSLTLDSIEYQFEDRTITVAFGQDLEGGQGALSLDDVAQWSPRTYSPSFRQTSSPSSEPLTGDSAELLRRLMERRQQQLGQ